MWVPIAIIGLAGAALSSLVGALVLLVAFDLVIQAAGVQLSLVQHLSLILLILLLPAIGTLVGAYFDTLCLPGVRAKAILKAGGIAGFILSVCSTRALDYLFAGVELIAVGSPGSLLLYFLQLCSGTVFCGGLIVAAISLTVAIAELVLQWLGYVTQHRLGVPLPAIRLVIIVLITSLSIHLIADLMLDVLKNQTLLYKV
jgi:hypothetical protein